MPGPGKSRRAHSGELSRVAGIRAVAALFARHPARVERLFFLPEMKVAAAPFTHVLAQARKPYREVAAEELSRIAGTVLHGGIVAVARPKPVFDLDPSEVRSWTTGNELVVVLDGVGNPHNLGAIARTAAYFGVKRMILSARSEQAGPSDAAMRVSEGGLEQIDIYRAADLPKVLGALGGRYRVMAAIPRGGVALPDVPRDRPVALVLGNEEEGVPAATLAACPHRVTIPGAGTIESLNVAAAAAILIHALAVRA